MNYKERKLRCKYRVRAHEYFIKYCNEKGIPYIHEL